MAVHPNKRSRSGSDAPEHADEWQALWEEMNLLRFKFHGQVRLFFCVLCSLPTATGHTHPSGQLG